MSILRRAVTGTATAMALAGALMSATASASNKMEPRNAAGLTPVQVSALDAALLRSGVTGKSKRELVENDRGLAAGIAVTVHQSGGAPHTSSPFSSKPFAQPNSWGSCGQGGSYQSVTWDPSIYVLNVYRQRLWTEYHHEFWCINYPAHTWVTYVRTPGIEPRVTTLGGIAGWNYDGLVYGPAGSGYTWRAGHSHSGFRIATTTKWHQCAVRIGCIQTTYPWVHIYHHSDGSGTMTNG